LRIADFATALNALLDWMEGILNGIWRLAPETARRDLAIPRLKLHASFHARKAVCAGLIVVRVHFGQFSSTLRHGPSAVNLNRKKERL
jgi:hypothetical protein